MTLLNLIVGTIGCTITAAAVVFSLPTPRKRLISSPIFNYFCRVLPPLSETEQAALKAGDVWFEGSLLNGKPDWAALYQYQEKALTPEEQQFLTHQVTHLCSLINSWDIEHEHGQIPEPIWDYLKQEKFFGMIIPKAYGGLDFSATAHAAVITKIATANVSTAVSTMVPNSLGPAELLMHYGTDAQKAHYLPRLASGEDIPCFALTGPEAGSDAGSIPDQGVIKQQTYNGQTIIGIELNWDKRYITLAPVATLMGLAFKLYDPEHLLGDKTALGICLCLIPTHLPGIEIGDRHAPLGMSFPNGPIRGRNVFVPLDTLIGGQSMIGQGWKMLVESLSAGRGISLPALSSASAQVSYRTTGAYAKIRKQFKMPIGQFEGIEEAIAQIAGQTYIVQAGRALTLTSLDLGHRPAIVTAIAKYHMTEYARQIVSHAMDVHGGKAIMSGPNNYLAQLYQATPISITVEGANILTRNLMIYGQGATRCHPFVQDELAAAAHRAIDEQAALEQFDGVLKKHILFTLKNIGKWLIGSISGGRLTQAYSRHKLLRYEQRINWMSATLAVATDVSFLVMGGALKRKERLSARLGDVLSYLFLSAAVLKQFHAHQKVPAHQVHARWALNYLGYQTQEALIRFYENFPIKGLGYLLKYMTFPFGRPYKANYDTLDHVVAQIAQSASDFRDEISRDCYIGDEQCEAKGMLDTALRLMPEVTVLNAKIDKALKQHPDKKQARNNKVAWALSQGIIHQNEASILDNFEKLRQKIIAVDEFSRDLKTKRQEKCSQIRTAVND